MNVTKGQLPNVNVADSFVATMEECIKESHKEGPEPSSCPNTRMILESEFIRELEASNSSDSIVIVSEDEVADTHELLLFPVEEEKKKQEAKLAKDEAMSRREVTNRIDKWLFGCEEENWLDEYSQDNNRYGVGRSAHINLKRAERARVTITKIL